MSRRQGRIVDWNERRGFGFVAPSDGGDDVFVHIRAYNAKAKAPFVGQRISFEVETSPEGKLRAAKVRSLADTPAPATPPTAPAAQTAKPAQRVQAKPRKRDRAVRAIRVKRPAAEVGANGRRASSITSYLAIIIFIPLVAVSVLFLGLPSWIIWPYLGMSVVGFLLYLQDKRAAQNGSWRVSERTLLLIGLACGWPGAIFAQQTLRHKTKKASFVILFWVSVIVNVAALALLATLTALPTAP